MKKKNFLPVLFGSISAFSACISYTNFQQIYAEWTKIFATCCIYNIVFDYPDFQKRRAYRRKRYKEVV